MTPRDVRNSRLCMSEIFICITYKMILQGLTKVHTTEAHWRYCVLSCLILITTYALVSALLVHTGRMTLCTLTTSSPVWHIYRKIRVICPVWTHRRTSDKFIVLTKGVAFAVFAANAYVILFVNKPGHPKHPSPLRRYYQNTLLRNMKTHF
jgi:hypothetical protein